eukprot:CAMPEP_0181322954 /NCGR_PEP_ID=MMETSP1101-20121128/19512_1 /TAXON_ID=46948 /ORGANISM="Rhodomonas abbreviata, Strain Caron Lab Isolate" /LENGTH=194 /DNA_ID=CAMNT_0023430919 /DNA_START=291 /DNA_END=875 /DNA_ORIENTATION=+
MLSWIGCNPEQLDKLRNEHFKKHFVGFGHGARYLQSAEGRNADANIMEVQSKIAMAEKQMESAANDGGSQLRKWLPKLSSAEPPSESAETGQSDVLRQVRSWGEVFVHMCMEPTQCFQCEATFSEATNKPTSCRHHTRGGGCIFDWDEDDFVHADFTCCDKNRPQPGCRVAYHSREDGLYAPHNQNRSWSTAHM